MSTRQAHSSRAGRQGAGDRVRRRRPRCRGRWAEAWPASTMPARTAPRPAACTPGRRSTTSWSPISAALLRRIKYGAPENEDSEIRPADHRPAPGARRRLRRARGGRQAYGSGDRRCRSCGWRLLLQADGDRRRAAERRDRAQGSVRAGAYRSRASAIPTRRSSGPTTPTTGWRPRSGPRDVQQGHAGREPPANTAAPGSTPTSLWSTRCRTAG